MLAEYWNFAWEERFDDLTTPLHIVACEKGFLAELKLLFYMF